ncbi:hypothetical protein FOZ63_026334, partial [Perkinsus olseni]
MWDSSVLCVISVMLLLSAAQRPPPPSGKYVKVVHEPTDCVRVDFLPGEAAEVELFIDCHRSEKTSDDLSVVEIRPFYYQVAANSTHAYEDFRLDVESGCPYNVTDGDLETFDYDYKANTVTVKFEKNPLTLSPGVCPLPS